MTFATSSDPTSSEVRPSDLAATLLRVSLGALFLAHAGLKLFVFTLPGTVQYFQSIGYPGYFAYLVIVAEAAGGAALVLGLWSRWVALAMVPILVGALVQHLPNGWVFTAAGGGWEFPAFWTLALLVQSLLGDGAWALRPTPGASPRRAIA